MSLVDYLTFNGAKFAENNLMWVEEENVSV